MGCPTDLLYSKDHEWARLEGDVVVVGITAHAQDALGDVVFVELPEVGQSLDAGESFGVVESVKAVNDLYSPCVGEVVEVNANLDDNPELVNKDAFGEGWLFKLKVVDEADVDNLLDPESYEELCPKD